MSNLIDLSKKFPETKRTFSGQSKRNPKQIFFTQEEFRKILATYSDHVAKGEWKDYAIDCNSDKACFSIFRHSYENPIFQISKRKNSKYWEYALNTQHRTIKRSRELSTILNLLKDPLKLV
ncbi:DUF2794 domain-containing protein [Curvivirga aplysinae]|uniref:DUF2794 domain-containing protein n=1 Tax=Curvivirga aplysinae TaxID=2529852 RepID=UPI0012BCE6A9|nr:DUF2794 domain-containing protein [Curvivirga aplysinae]MTI10018.1 DUF2794 domain-containing protein [Curvivirga aplysinae]